jgi:hypothetical protein
MAWKGEGLINHRAVSGGVQIIGGHWALDVEPSPKGLQCAALQGRMLRARVAFLLPPSNTLRACGLRTFRTVATVFTSVIATLVLTACAAVQ